MAGNDAELVSQSLAGSRDAFGRIVEQYQSLICSVAYSATGSLTQSEDVAQETFVIAWKQLRQLREPAKLRSWLCSIARSVISKTVRRQIREPAHGAETLDAAQETAAPGLMPTERTINHEEEAILWRSLEQIPEIYREPLVLFYREHDSIESVAQKLELSEDAVKQRLSRGRKLLTEEVTAFVEGTLRRTNPGKTFTLGVLAALPVTATSSKAAVIGVMAATGSTAAKTTLTMGLFGTLFAPVLGLLAGIMGTRMSISNATSPRDRQFRIKMARFNWSLAAVFNVAFAAMIYFATSYRTTHTLLFTWIIIGAAVGYGFLIIWLARWTLGRKRQIAREEAAGISNTKAAGHFYEYRSSWKLLGLPLVHIRFGGRVDQRQPAKGWIACGNAAYGILLGVGGVATGLVSVGGIAIGGVAIGGGTLGVLALGGMAFGSFAMGGVALGYMSCGGAAAAWMAACGGAATAHNFALGGCAVAQHANDKIAVAFMQSSWFFSNAYRLLDFAFLFVCALAATGFLFGRKPAQQAGR